MSHLFPNHRRVTRRHLRNAALGNPTTVSAFIIWVAAFAALWIFIVYIIEANDPIRNCIDTGNYAVEQLEAYRSENDTVPDGLEVFGFRKSGNNSYYIQLPHHNAAYGIDYIKTSDTTYHIRFGSERFIGGEWLPAERMWRIVNNIVQDTTLVKTF